MFNYESSRREKIFLRGFFINETPINSGFLAVARPNNMMYNILCISTSYSSGGYFVVPSIDIHCHILPGVDDGSPNMETSLCMLKTALLEGTKGMILTPHHKPMHRNVSPRHIEEYTLDLMERAHAQGINVQLFPGNEIYYSDSTVRELPLPILPQI